MLRRFEALHYLWRAVDQHGVVLDILVRERRNATAAKRFFKRLLAAVELASWSRDDFKDLMRLVRGFADALMNQV